MYNFFTSDTHFCHSNIVKYCNRPYRDIEHMNESFIRNWNQRVKQEDTVYSLGDWCFRLGVDGTKSAQYWEEQLNGHIIHIKGNHDSNNNLNTILDAALLSIGNYVVLAKHIPAMMKLEIPEFCDFMICGHIHGKWKHTFIDDVPIINVGVDVWNYTPVRMDELIVYYEKLIRDKIY